MACSGMAKSVPSRRAMIAEIFSAGKVKQAVSHRLFQCTHATDCNRLCERLVKGPGKAAVWCVDVETGLKTNLYPSLEYPEFRCPKSLF